MSIDGEKYIKFPSIGFWESLKEAKKEKKCMYCEKILKENPWWNFWSFRPFCEIGRDVKTNQWAYVCDGCTIRFVSSMTKQMRKLNK